MTLAFRRTRPIKKPVDGLVYFWMLGIVLVFVGCQSLSKERQRPEQTITKSEVIYGLGDDELNFLGKQLGFKVENLGMSVYRFTRGSQVFGVSVHNDLSANDRTRADEPVVLEYSIGDKHPVRAQFSVVQGVTLGEVEARFRDFIRRIPER